MTITIKYENIIQANTADDNALLAKVKKKITINYDSKTINDNEIKFGGVVKDH